MWTITRNFKRFMRRLFLSLFVIFVAIAIVHIAVNAILTLQIRSAILALHKKGVPTRLEAVMPPPVPENENAAPLYEKAFDLMMNGKEGLKYKSVKWDGNILFNKTINAIDKAAYKDMNQLKTDEKKEIIKLYDSPEMQKIYTLIKKASRKPECDFYPAKNDLKQLYGTGLDTGYVRTRIMSHVIKHLSLRAHLEAESGNINKAIGTLLMAFRILHHLENIPDKVSQMVRCYNADDMISLMQEILAAHSISQEKIRSFMNELSTYDNMTPLLNAVNAEMAYGIQEIEETTTYDRSYFGLNVYLEAFLPNFYKRFLEQLSTKKERLSYLQVALTVYDNYMLPYYKISKELKDFPPLMKKNYDRLEGEKLYLSFLARHQATVTVAKVGLGLKLYKIQHGTYPESLNKLKPDFLKEIPLDPFTGTELIYKKQKDGFILYSVGHNLKDDGGISYVPPIYYTTKGDVVWKSEN